MPPIFPTSPFTLTRVLVGITWLFLILDVTMLRKKLTNNNDNSSNNNLSSPPPFGWISESFTFHPQIPLSQQIIPLIFSFVSPAHGFVPAALACSFFGEALEVREKLFMETLSLQNYSQVIVSILFIVFIVVNTMLINITAWNFLYGWSMLLPHTSSPPPYPVVGFGGLASMVVFADAFNGEIGLTDYSNVENFFPFRVGKWRPVLLALILHIFRAGDVDLLCAVGCGKLMKEIVGNLTTRNTMHNLLPTFSWLGFNTSSSSSSNNVRYHPLSQQQQQPKQHVNGENDYDEGDDQPVPVVTTTTTTTHIQQPTREEKRLQMLAAAEARVNKLLI
jgi:hypothetical protein